MKKYVYSLVGSVGYFERFLQPQTPEQVAQKVSQAIADPTVLDGNRCLMAISVAIQRLILLC